MNFKITLLATILLLSSCSRNSKEEVPSNTENSVFPDSWTGEYEGGLYINKNGLAMDTNFMKMRIHRLDINRTAFHIKYQSDSNWREYEIKPGKTNSHWIMDEKNSILLDHYFQNNEFSSVFSVNESMLKANYRKQGDTIISTITTYPLQYVKETGDSVTYTIKSYKEQLVQRAVLIRKR
jgi:hypothetical protein